MATIEDIIQQAANPFDPVTFKTGNFWQEGNSTVDATVNSIHQTELQKIIQLLDLVAADHHTRTVLLAGDVGSGKSYILKRLKEDLNNKAFFVYIPPFVDSDQIWRHTLRQTVDSLMYTPEGQQESQILLWLKSLSVFQSNSLSKSLLGEKKLFVRNLRAAYPVGINQAKHFFGVLYHLSDPDLYDNACSWLRGDDLDEDDLDSLGIKKSIDSEAAAQGILANLGKISTSTYPIVLCFDQVETNQLPDGSANIQPIFNVNTSFHNERAKNFLVVISIVTNTWKQNVKRIQQSDKDRIERAIALKQISLTQAEALWASRLHLLHQQAKTKPSSNIYPLTRGDLKTEFPGGKTTPRRTLSLGQKLFQSHKLGEEPSSIGDDDLAPTFKLLWEKEYSLTERKVTRMQHFSEPELILMLSRVASALQMENIQLKLLPSPTYASYSFSYQKPKSNEKIGLIWADNPSRTFFHTMKACDRIQKSGKCHRLDLVRTERSGKSTNQGYKLFQRIFLESNQNQHIKPDLDSIHYLATYNRLVNSVLAQELVLSDKALDLNGLESLVRDLQILDSCSLLQELKLVSKPIGSEFNNVRVPSENRTISGNKNREKEFLLSFIQTQHLVSRRVASQTVLSQFPKLADGDINLLVQELCQETKIRILDESVAFDDQIICLIPPQ